MPTSFPRVSWCTLSFLTARHPRTPHHTHTRSAPYSNLFTNLDSGLGSRLWDASGDILWGTHRWG